MAISMDCLSPTQWQCQTWLDPSIKKAWARSVFHPHNNLARGFLRYLCCCKPKKQQKYPPLPTISNPSVEDGGLRSEGRLSYRHQVLKALVQRYIDTARREFEESRRKDLGNRLTELNKSVLCLHSEMKHLRRSVATNGTAANPLDGASVLHKYIMKVRNSFQNFDHDSGSSGQGSPAEVVVHQDEVTAEHGESTSSPGCLEGDAEAEENSPPVVAEEPDPEEASAPAEEDTPVEEPET